MVPNRFPKLESLSLALACPARGIQLPASGTPVGRVKFSCLESLKLSFDSDGPEQSHRLAAQFAEAFFDRVDTPDCSLSSISLHLNGLPGSLGSFVASSSHLSELTIACAREDADVPLQLWFEHLGWSTSNLAHFLLMVSGDDSVPLPLDLVRLLFSTLEQLDQARKVRLCLNLAKYETEVNEFVESSGMRLNRLASFAVFAPSGAGIAGFSGSWRRRGDGGFDLV
ncbi:hypothetical protein JCM10212_002177 [Sporobolomyces blumeae]